MEEVFKRQKGEPLDALASRIIQTRAKGRCEYEWYTDGSLKSRCRELHGEPAIGFKGVVKLELMPTNGLYDRRVAHLKVYCQKHAYQLLEAIATNISAGARDLKKAKESTPDQTRLL